MEKKTYAQIMELVEESFKRVEDFVYLRDNYCPRKFSEAALEAERIREEYRILHQPKYNTPEYDTFCELKNKYVVRWDEFTESLGLGPIKEIEEHGRGEGDGEEYYKVFNFPLHDVYVRIDGYYESYNDTSFNGTSFNGWSSCKEVRPVERMVTFYE